MNLLYSYPIIVPITSSSDSDMSGNMLISMILVINVIWLLSLIIAIIHTAIINMGRKSYKETLRDRDYLFFVSIGATAIDVLMLFLALSYWVATLI